MNRLFVLLGVLSLAACPGEEPVIDAGLPAPVVDAAMPDTGSAPRPRPV